MLFLAVKKLVLEGISRWRVKKRGSNKESNDSRPRDIT